MGHDNGVSGVDKALFEDLLRQVDEFLVEASRRVRDVVAGAVAVGTPLAVGIHQGQRGRCRGSVHYRDLPHPLSLLILGSSLFEPGDDIAVVVQRAGMADLRREARWPFDLATAEWLTRPRDEETTP